MVGAKGTRLNRQKVFLVVGPIAAGHVISSQANQSDLVQVH